MKSSKYISITRFAAGVALAPLALCGATAMAQEASSQSASSSTDTTYGDIVVTAQRREQTALKVPLSLTALDESLIESKQVGDVTDLQFVAPGIRTGHQNGMNRIFIRGIGLSSFASGADSSVAFYADGVYVGRPTQQLSSFYDVERIEVLRGPQGALYGRNATGGAVNLITKDPEREIGGYVDVTLGNYDLHELEGAISIPLSENGDFRARAAVKLLDRNGYGYDVTSNNEVNDASSQSGRLTLQYNPDSSVNVRLIGEYTRERDHNYYVQSFGAYQFDSLANCPYTDGTQCLLQGVAQFDAIEVSNSQDAATNVQWFPGLPNRRQGYAVTLDASFDLGNGFDIRSISGWRQFDRYNASNAGGESSGIGNVDYDEENEQISQEIVLNYTSDALQVTAGGSFYHEDLENHVLAPFVQFDNPATPQLDMPYRQDGTLKIDAYAAYLQATYSIMPEFRVTAAGRYSYEKRKTDGAFTFGVVVPTDNEKSWDSFTPKFGIEFDVVPGTMLYASYTKGFKSGTFNVGQVNPAINPEKIESYEAGIKSRLLDGALDITAAYFHYKYKDLQVQKIIGIATVTTNAAAATTDGFEIAATARLTPQFTLTGNFTYLDSKFTDFCSINPLAANYQSSPQCTDPATPGQDLSGNRLAGSPKYAFVVGGQYVLPVGNNGAELVLNGDVSYQSRVHFSEFNDLQLSQKSATKVNASLKYDSGDAWSVTVWGKNITDVFTANNKLQTIALWGYPIYGSTDAPATFGGTFAVKF